MSVETYLISLRWGQNFPPFKKMKQTLSLFLLFFTALFASAYDVEVDGLYYNLDTKTNTATLTAKSTSYSTNAEAFIGDIIVPETITVNDVVYTVTAVDSRTFASCDKLTSIVFPATITNIGTYLFNNCKGLTKCQLPDGIDIIPTCTFNNCVKLTEIVLPTTLTEISNTAFYGCSALKELVLPSGLRTISDNAFNGSGLKSITFSDSLRTIGMKAFYNCTSITEVVFPDSLSEISEQAFYGCTALKRIQLGKGIRKLYAQAFNSCSVLTEVYILAPRLVSANTNSFSYSNKPRIHVDNNYIEKYAISMAWGDCPEILPLKCTEPYVYCENGNLQFYSDTNLSHCDNVESVSYTIHSLDDGSGLCPVTDQQLTASYLVEVVSSAPELQPSDKVSVTISWANCAGALYKEDELPTGTCPTADKTAVTFRAQGGILLVEGVPDGTPLRLYTPEGRLVATATSVSGTAFFHHIPRQTALIVNFGNESVKIWSE